MPLLELKDPFVTSHIDKLRHGYPDRPYAEQCRGLPFRRSAIHAVCGIAKYTQALLSEAELSRLVVMMPWRAGLAFADAYQLPADGRGAYHISSRRDESTLETVVDYERGEVAPDSVVVVADPMLATGNTSCDAIERLIVKGVSPEDILVNAVVAAPEGVAHVLEWFPDTRIVVGALDQKLDERGYIVPGLGDFGDKYFDDMSLAEKYALADTFGLDIESKRRLITRLTTA